MATFNGDSAPNIFTGGADADTAHGNGGDDALSGNGGNDMLAGGSGSDSLSGGDDADTLYSGVQSPPFNQPYYNNPYTPPVLDTGSEVDTLSGGGGDDRLFAGYGDNVDGGANGYSGDYLFISFLGAPAGVTVDFRLASQVIGGGTIQNVENISWVQGSNYADDINVSSAFHSGYSDFTAVFGMGGDDRLVAGYYTGVLDGGDGNDVVDGRGSQYLQLVEGGAGDDTLYTNTNTFGTARGGDGNDTIYSHGSTYGGAGNDVIVLQWSYYAGGVFGEAGDDDITASAVGHNIAGGAGADTLRGNTGNDTLTAADFQGTSYTPAYDMGLEQDRLTGGGGNDTLAIGYGDYADGGVGNDSLWLSLGGLAAGATFSTAGIVSGQPYVLGGGTIQNIENLAYLRGTNFDDALTIATQATLLTIDAGDGNDTVWSGSSSVALSGGNGNDHFHSGIAGDTFDGGAGFDAVDYSSALAGVTVVLAAPGLTGNGGGGDSLINVEAVVGSGFADSLTGNGQYNLLIGGDGDDILKGEGGDDRLMGGAGDDSYAGGEGVDTLDFSRESGPVAVNLNESLFTYPSGHPFATRSIAPGEALDSFGNYETISGIENLILTAGNDTALGSEGANRIEAGAGNDLVIGAGGDDVIFGGDGDDTMSGGSGANVMTGGLGNDIYLVESGTDTVVENAGEGTDEVRTTLAGYSLLGTQLENLRAISNVAHDFRGNGSNNVVAGGGGSDVIRLQDGGDDSAVGGGGDDQIFYGAAFTASDTNNGGAGTDVLVLQGNYAVTMAAGSLTEIEYLSLQSASSTRYQDPSDSHDYDIAFVDANVTSGQRFIINAAQLLAHEDFRFDGSAESDGSFLIYGGYGADLLTGGSGNDVFHFEGSRWGAGDSVNGGAGADSVVIRAGSGIHRIQFSETQLIGVESVSVSDRFGLGQASLPSYEMILANGNVAPGGTLIVNGSTLLDPSQFLNVDGSAVSGGQLKLYGGAGADTLTGGAGNDLIYAGGGADRMTGGEGADTFQLRSLSDSSASGPDQILDFVSGVDKIDLSFIDANSIAAGNQAFTFVGAAFSGNGTAGSGVAGELRAYQDMISGAWFVEGDVNGDGNADFEIAVFTATQAHLVSSDFIP